MMNGKFQIIYREDKEKPGEFMKLWQDEVKTFIDLGLNVAMYPDEEAETLILRSYCISKEEDYPKDKRYLHNFEINANYLFMDRYYPLIEDLTIETFFVDELNEDVVNEVERRGWKKSFIKKGVHALEHIEEGLSVYPDHSFEEMMEYFRFHEEGKYAVRKWVDPKTLESELRYWVLNGKIYRRDNIIPDIVYEAKNRLDRLGGKYYTIDATHDIIIEVNPGESSDRHGENSAELFASWFIDAFSDNQ